MKLIELNFQHLIKAVENARQRKCDKVIVTGYCKFTIEEDSKPFSICITEIEDLTREGLDTQKTDIFSDMCAEEIQEVAIKLQTDDTLKYTKHEKKLLILIANLALILRTEN